TAVEILDRLVAFDTTSSRSNLELIGWVADYLERHGIASTRSSAGEGKANLYATIGPPVSQKTGRGGVLLSGHTDVVPVAGQAWTSDPFHLTERDHRLYARGSADMKGFLALVLALVPEMVRSPLKVPLHIAFTHDEETGCFGAPALIRALPQSAGRPMLAIIGEPTSMQIATAQKGCGFYRTRVLGQEGHSSAPGRGVNAIFAAAETETIVEVPPRLPDPGSPAEALARRLTGANTTTTVSFASEAGLYQQAGIPAIVCGPGSIDVAHKPDEFITRAELADGQVFLDRLLQWARSGDQVATS